MICIGIAKPTEAYEKYSCINGNCGAWCYTLFSAWFWTGEGREKEPGRIHMFIDGKPTPAEELNKLSYESIKQVHYLHGRDAIHLMGPVGAEGVLLVKSTKKEKTKQPVVLAGGRRISLDSLKGLSFHRIDVVRGAQAQQLYGPGASGGVLLLHQEKEKGNEEPEKQ